VLGAEWRDRRWQPFEHTLGNIAEAFARGAVNYWLRSDVLSPHVSAGDGGEQGSHGLILVQPGFRREGRTGDASISVVDRVFNTLTGEERRFDHYRRIFERLRRSMRKRLVVATMLALPNGTQTSSWRMTARAADAHVAGSVRFLAEPIGLKP
jgi:hypothetical protein